MYGLDRLLVLLVPGLLLLADCQTPSDASNSASVAAAESTYQQDPAERDAVLTALRTMRQDAFHDAFAALPRYHYTRYKRTEQRDASGRRTAFTEQVTRIERPEGQVRQTLLQADSAGAFDTGALGRFVTAGSDEGDVAALPRYVLLDDPPYLTPRNRDAYWFRFLPDTSFWGIPTQVIEVRARPGQAQPIRHTRLYLDRASKDLVAVYLERTENTLFFSEESRFYLRLRPMPGGGWAPFTMRFRTHLRLPFRAPQQVRTVSAYYHYEPAG